MENLNCIERKISNDRKSVFLTLEFKGAWSTPTVKITPDADTNQGDEYDGIVVEPTDKTSPIILEVKASDATKVMSENDNISINGARIATASSLKEKGREQEVGVINDKIKKLLSEQSDGMQAKLKKVIVKKEDAELVITFSPPSDWDINKELEVRFVSKVDGIESEAVSSGKGVAEKNEEGKETGNLVLKIQKSEFDASGTDNKHKIPFDTIDKANGYLVQIKGKGVSQPWATQINDYYLVRANVSLFKNNIPLEYSSDNPGVYGIQKPVVILYSNVREEYPNLPEHWPGKEVNDANKINVNVVLHELGMDTNQGTLDFVIEANVDYEIIRGLKLKRIGFEYRKRAITKQQQVLVDKERNKLRKLELEAFLEDATKLDEENKRKALNAGK